MSKNSTSEYRNTKGKNCHLSAQEELEPVEELGLCLHGLGLLPGGLHGLAVVSHGDVVQLSHLQTGAPLRIFSRQITLLLDGKYGGFVDPDTNFFC